MNWQKVKKVVIPLLFIKLLIFVFFIVKNDLVSISREISYTEVSQQGIENDSIVQKKQRLIRIVRNEEDKGIIIQLRKKKNAVPFSYYQKEPSNPLVD